MNQAVVRIPHSAPEPRDHPLNDQPHGLRDLQGRGPSARPGVVAQLALRFLRGRSRESELHRAIQWYGHCKADHEVKALDLRTRYKTVRQRSVGVCAPL